MPQHNLMAHCGPAIPPRDGGPLSFSEPDPMHCRSVDPHQDDPWRRSIPIGANAAAFAFDEPVRCPATVIMENGTPTICGGGLGTAEDDLQVIVIGRVHRSGRPGRRAPGALIRQVCRRCRQSYRLVPRRIAGAA